eukprot:2906692-Rhodomonas_salina.2
MNKNVTLAQGRGVWIRRNLIAAGASREQVNFAVHATLNTPLFQPDGSDWPRTSTADRIVLQWSLEGGSVELREAVDETADRVPRVLQIPMPVA